MLASGKQISLELTALGTITFFKFGCTKKRHVCWLLCMVQGPTDRKATYVPTTLTLIPPHPELDTQSHSTQTRFRVVPPQICDPLSLFLVSEVTPLKLSQHPVFTTKHNIKCRLSYRNSSRSFKFLAFQNRHEQL